MGTTTRIEASADGVAWEPYVAPPQLLDDLLTLPLPEPSHTLTHPHFVVRKDWSTIITTSWPEEMDISGEFLDDADFRHMRRNGLRVHFAVANGEAEYVLTGYDPTLHTVRAARLYCRMWEAPAVAEPKRIGGGYYPQRDRA